MSEIGRLMEEGMTLEKAVSINLLAALDRLSAPHIPSPEEAAHLDAAMRHLIAAFRMRDFAPGEEALWNCHGITIDGEAAGSWEVRIRQTDAIAEPSSAVPPK